MQPRHRARLDVVHAVADHHLRAALQRRDEARDLVEVVRQVGVGHHDVAAARGREAGEVGAAVAAPALDDDARAGLLGERARSRPRSRCRRRPPRRCSPIRASASQRGAHARPRCSRPRSGRGSRPTPAARWLLGIRRAGGFVWTTVLIGGGSAPGFSAWARSHAVITRVAAESGGFCSQIPARCYRSVRIHGMMHGDMRICIVYDCLFPYTVGGAERWYRNLAERLAAGRPRGHLPDAAPVGSRRARRDRPARAGRRRGPADGALHRRRPPADPAAARVRRWACSAHLLRHGRALRRRAHLRLPLLLAARRRARAAADALRAGRRLVRGVEPLLLARLPRRRRRARSASSCSALCARVPQRAFCFSELHAARLREEGLRGAGDRPARPLRRRAASRRQRARGRPARAVRRRG